LGATLESHEERIERLKEKPEWGITLPILNLMKRELKAHSAFALAFSCHLAFALESHEERIERFIGLFNAILNKIRESHEERIERLNVIETSQPSWYRTESHEERIERYQMLDMRFRR
jgi:hypothetical protein